MSYWAFSDVFEEQGIVRTPFYGGFGLVAADHIPKPALNVFRALHELGNQRLPVSSDAVLATRKGKGIVAAVWHYAPPDGTGPSYTPPPSMPEAPRTFTLNFAHVKGNAVVRILRVDEDHGNVLKTFNAMGRPPGDLTMAQVTRLQAAGQMAPAEDTRLHNGSLTLSIPRHGLAVFIVEP